MAETYAARRACYSYLTLYEKSANPCNPDDEYSPGDSDGSAGGTRRISEQARACNTMIAFSCVSFGPREFKVKYALGDIFRKLTCNVGNL